MSVCETHRIMGHFLFWKLKILKSEFLQVFFARPCVLYHGCNSNKTILSRQKATPDKNVKQRVEWGYFIDDISAMSRPTFLGI